MMSTPADICRFAEKLFKGKLIRTESLAEMTRWQENTGAGLFRFPFGTLWASGHTGGIDAYLSVYGHFQSEDIIFAITSNATNMAFPWYPRSLKCHTKSLAIASNLGSAVRTT